MENIGQRYIKIRGTRTNIWRAVRKDEKTNTYWIKYNYGWLQVVQRYDCPSSTGDWVTVAVF